MPEQYQKEIEEILEKADVESPAPKRRANLSFGHMIWLQLRQSVGGKTWSMSPGRVMLIAGSLLLASLLLRAVLPGIVGPLAWAGLLIFIIGYGLFFINAPKDSQKRWRGQPLDDMPDGPAETWLDRIRQRFKNKR